MLLMLLGWTASIQAQVRLTYVNAAGDETRQRDVTIASLEDGVYEAALPEGPTLRVPAERVLDVVFLQDEPHVAAQQALNAGRWRDAAQLWRQAMSAEKRPWAKWEVQSRLVQAAEAAGETDLAARAFLDLTEQDAPPRLLRWVPLAWDRGDDDPDFRQTCERWLNDPSLWARLVSASWLLTSPQHADATEVLRGLTRCDDPRIRDLARCQLWRSELRSASEQEVETWQSQLAPMTPSDQAGGRWLVAQAWARLEPGDRAALAALEVAFGDTPQPRLIAESLLLAARQLLAAHPDEARRLLDELQQRFPESDAHQLGTTLRKESL